MNKIFHPFLLFLAGSFVCLYLAFSAAVNVPYASHDSIRFFHKFFNKGIDSSAYPQYQYEYDLGRPVTAEVEGFLYGKINHLSDMSRLRLLTIFICALCASLLAITALSAGLEMVPAFCLGTVIFTLPGIQDFIFVPYPANALALFFSLLACILLSKELKFRVHSIFAFVLLETSFFLYPPSTFSFLVPAALMVVFNKNWQTAKKACISSVTLWVLAAAVNYIILRGFFYALVKSSGHEISFTLKQTLHFAMTFLTQGLPQVFNFWNVYYSNTLGVAMVFIIAVFFAVEYSFTKKFNWFKLFAWTVIFLITNLVWFLFGGYIPREFIASQALALILAYWCGDWSAKRMKLKRDYFLKAWPVIFLCFGLIVANRMMSSNVLNNYSELMFIRSRVAQFVGSSTKVIHVIRLKDNTKGYNGLPMVYDNINSATSDYEIPDLIRVALKDMGDPFELHCIVDYSNEGQPVSILPNEVIIDMNDLVYISSPELK